MRVYNARAATNHRAALVHVTLVHDAVIVDVISSKLGNSPDKLCQTRSVAYLVELFMLISIRSRWRNLSGLLLGTNIIV